MNTLANVGWQGPANRQAQDFREAASSRSSSLQSAWRDGGGSASCNACPSLTARQGWPETSQSAWIEEVRAPGVRLALH